MIKKLETTDLITMFNALIHVIVMQNQKLKPKTTVITNLIYYMYKRVKMKILKMLHNCSVSVNVKLLLPTDQ